MHIWILSDLVICCFVVLRSILNLKSLHMHRHLHCVREVMSTAVLAARICSVCGASWQCLAVSGYHNKQWQVIKAVNRVQGREAVGHLQRCDMCQEAHSLAHVTSNIPSHCQTTNSTVWSWQSLSTRRRAGSFGCHTEKSLRVLSSNIGC